MDFGGPRLICIYIYSLNLRLAYAVGVDTKKPPVLGKGTLGFLCRWARVPTGPEQGGGRILNTYIVNFVDFH